PGMAGGPGGFGGRRGRGGEARGGGGGGGGMSDEQRQRMRQTMQLVFQAPLAFTIAQSDSSVTFASDRGATLDLYGDGRKVSRKPGDHPPGGASCATNSPILRPPSQGIA